MPIQLGRPLLSYSKVQTFKAQTFVGVILRNRSAQALRKRLRSIAYLDVVCGSKVHGHMLNCDFQWHPKVDLCWDIARKPLPVIDDRLIGIFSEHYLEHYSTDMAEWILHECFRLLAPRGVLRLILPDAERHLRFYIYILDDACRSALYSPHGFFGLAKLAIICRKGFRSGRDPALLFVSESRRVETFAMEAVRP